MGEIHQLVLSLGSRQARSVQRDAFNRRAIDAASEVLAEESNAIGITYAGFCLTSLPHRRLPDDQPWRRSSRRLSLMIEPGRLPTDERLYGVPYGSRARLILLYLQTQAVQGGSPEVELGRSMRAWMGRLGVSLGGQSYRDVREQANRISACRMTFSWNEGRALSFARDSVVAGGMGFHEQDAEPAGRRLWVDTIRLSDAFYRALREHPVPIWEPALRHICNQSLTIDVYIWLAYRLHCLERPTPVSWAALHGQFGAGYKNLYQFKPRFVDAVKLACAVYEQARVDLGEAGLVLHPSAPPVAPRALSG